VALLGGVACGAIVTSHARADDGVVLSLPPEDQQLIDALLGPNVVGQALPSTPIANASLYFPLQERQATVQVTRGPNHGEMQALGVAKGARPNGNPAWRLGLSPTLAGFIRQTEAGDLLMPAVSDTGEGVIIVTTPPNPFLLNGMKPGETRTLSQTVSVNYLD